MNSFRRRDIDELCYLIAREYKKSNKNNPGIEIILVGGASVLLNYNFREETTDLDSLIRASSSIKDVIKHISKEKQLPDNWINDDFRKTNSYSDKLVLHSKFYKRFCDCLDVRTVSGEYLLAMKLRSFRNYKNDISDIVDILKKQKEFKQPITIDENI